MREEARRLLTRSGQVVTLEDEGREQVRVVGLTSDFGFLRTVPVHSDVTSADASAWGPTGCIRSIDLQPDGNSFDMLRNLVRRKA